MLIDLKSKSRRIYLKFFIKLTRKYSLIYIFKNNMIKLYEEILDKL